MQDRFAYVLGMVSWVHNQIAQGTNPRVVLGSLVPSDADIPDDLDDGTLWRLIVSIISEPPRRKKLDSITKLESVLHLLRNCKKIIVLTGAGVSDLLCYFCYELIYGGEGIMEAVKSVCTL